MKQEKVNDNLYSPFEIVKEIHAREFVLPRFQRELDWKTDRIIKLFDSIYKGFNINLVVLWKPKEHKPNYQFISDYTYNQHNPEDTTEISSGKTFVLDGQQRFEALYIGLYGSYTDKTGVTKKLYFYLDDPGKQDAFAFISNKEYNERHLNKNFYLKVSDLRKYNAKDEIIDGLITDIKKELDKLDIKLANDIDKKEQEKLKNEIECYNEKIKVIKGFKKNILKLYDKLKERSIMYYMLDNSLDDYSVEELFVRMNTGGSQLSNAEIILSKLSTKWDSNARESINNLIDKINNPHLDEKSNKQVYDYLINLDFVMKAMLVLLDKQSVSFKLNEILNNDDLIKEMENKFERISNALLNAFYFVREYGLNRDVLKSNNAIIPIAYLLYKHNLYGSNPSYFFQNLKYRDLQKSMIKWLCVTTLSRYWAGATDTQLVAIRTTLNEYTGKIHNMDFYHCLKQHSAVEKIDKNFIEEKILKYTYNSPNKYSVLCILYLNNDNNFNYIRSHYDVDHIFPKSKFNDKCYDDNEIDENSRKFYKDNWNLLPNLQLLNAKENRSDKKDKYFDEWIKEFYTGDKIQTVLDTNYIDKVYKFKQFKSMFNARKRKIKEALLEILK